MKFSIDEIEIIDCNQLLNDEEYVAWFVPEYGTWEPTRAWWIQSNPLCDVVCFTESSSCTCRGR